MIFRKDIQGLRGVAVVFVILYHYFPHIINGGIFGVDIFFVISGYVITNSLLEGEKSILRFYQKRVNRIYPAAYFCLLWVSINKSTLISIATLYDICAAIVFTSNFRFYYSSVDYFSNTNSPILHYWSLSIENQFYLIYPIILKIVHKYISLFLFSGFLFSFSHLFMNYKLYPEYSYFITYTRLWEIIIGCIASYMRNYYSKINKIIKELTNMMCILIIFVIAFVGSRYYIIPGPFTLIPILITVVLCIEYKESFAIVLLTNAFIRFFGLISYSLYLYHYPIKYLSTNLQHKIILTLILSFISYLIIEKPFQRIKLSYKLYFSALVIIICCFLHYIEIKISKMKKSSYIYRNFCKPLCNKLKAINNKYLECLWIKEKLKSSPDYNSVKYIFLGDSHLEQYHQSLQYFFKGTTIHYYYFFFHLYYHDLHILEKMIEPFTSIQAIVVSFLLNLKIFNKTLSEEEKLLEKYLKMLRRYSKEVIFIQDIPFLDFDPIEALKRGLHTFEIGVNATRVMISIKDKEIKVVNPFEAFCPYKICNYMLNNLSIYRDKDHLNGFTIKNIVIYYLSKHLNIHPNCSHRNYLYLCDLRLNIWLNSYSKHYAKEHNLQILKRLHPHPEI